MKKKLETYLRSSKVRLVALLIIVTACVPLFQRDPYILHVLILIGIYTIYSSSWNLLAYSGQASLGHAAFLGIGGFTSTLLVMNWGISPWLGLLTGSALAAGIGFLVGLTCVRLREWFLAMVTFGFAIIAGTITTALDRFTHGIWGYRTPSLVDSNIQYYYAIVFLAVVSVFLMHFIMKSKIGLAFSAIRENELEAKTMGVNTTKYKLMAFVLSTFFAGLAGALNAHYIKFINVKIYDVRNSFAPLTMTIIGGLGTIEGPIIGSVLITFIEAFLQSIIDPTLQWIIIGLFLILVVIFLPKGISSLLRKALKR